MRLPWVTENTIDLASDINESLRVADGLIPGRVTHLKPAPVGPHVDGQRIGVTSPASGAFAGKGGQIAIYVEEGDFWQFYPAVLCVFDNAAYVSNGTTWVAV